MDVGHFYFLSNQYFIDFPDLNLMQNKKTVNGQQHDRPCFYAFLDKRTGLYWMIPFSSKVKKYERVYEQKVAKYGSCQTIAFGSVLGRRKAFLIQNMCPVTQKYISNEYIDSASSLPVRVDGALERHLIQSATKVLVLQRQGKRLIFPDVLKIEKLLLQQE